MKLNNPKIIRICMLLFATTPQTGNFLSPLEGFAYIAVVPTEHTLHLQYFTRLKTKQRSGLQELQKLLTFLKCLPVMPLIL